MTGSGRRPLDRVLARIDQGGPFPADPLRPVEGGCWIWPGAKTGGGYGAVKVDGQTVYVHRLVYEELVGPIPDGHQIDHLCRVRLCGNPAHLEAVEGLENVHRGLAVRYRTHCRNGHPINEENTYIVPSTGARQCRACKRDRQRRAA